MKKGFTLIEMIAVVIILAIISILAVPPILKSIRDSKNEISNAMKEVIYNASNLYITSNRNDYPLTNDNIYCVPLKTLTEQDYLNSPIIDPTTKDEIDENQFVKINIIDGKYNYEAVSECVENYQPNVPELTDKLIPVVYEDNTWKVANITNKWYDYNNKQWANAVILNNGTTKTVGDTLDLNNDVAMMYVWIPRYEYKLPAESIGATGTPKPIDIKFINANKTTADTGYFLHPGFTFDGKNKSGIWIAKFEATSTDSTCLTTANAANCNKVQGIKSLPNSDSLRYITVSNMFNSSRKAQTDYNLTGLDIHMSKYTEWTATSYLTNSKYGRCTGDSCTEVTINNYYKNTTTYNTLTGCAGVTNSSTTTCANTYEKPQGQLASTTGNIYGVYDMVGGIWEHVMGYLTNANSNYASDPNKYFGWTSSTNYAGFTSKPEEKYYDAFTSNNIATNNYSTLTTVNGKTDFSGIFNELLNDKTRYNTWFGDYAYSVTGDSPWFRMSGDWSGNTLAGIFGSHSSGGFTSIGIGFRVVITSEK